MNTAFIKKYVQQGFCVFPLPFKSKVPFQGWHWKVLQSRTPTHAELASWFQSRVNVAIVTGHVSGNLAVLDFDNLIVFSVWYDHTRLESAAVQTGNGCHIYVKILDPESLHNGNFQVDGVHAGQVRFDGGYVVAPPSVHPSGKVYQWIDDLSVSPVLSVTVNDLHIEQDTQKAWQTPVDRESLREHPQALKTSQSPGVKYPDHYAREALRREAEKVKQSIQGTRNTVLFQAGLKTRKCVDVLGVRVVVDTLVQAGLSCGLSEQESVRTIQQAWKTARY